MPKIMPDNVLNALKDIIDLSRDGRISHWRDAMDYAEKVRDPELLVALGNLLETLSSIEAKARAARQGKYED